MNILKVHFFLIPPFDPFHVKKGNIYIMTLCMFLKGNFLRNALKNPHQNQMNNK
jgi:hypothetical protein